MTKEYNIPESMLKRAAKRLSKKTAMSHMQWLDELAIENGFRDWSELKQKGQYVPIAEGQPNESLNQYLELTLANVRSRNKVE